MAAENYHLKWDSHLSYLNSSIATLYKNEKFADVMLYSSSSSSNACTGSVSESGIPTVGISAHKFILSSCSQFFATMFETSPIASPNGVLFVVLPPELSHRAIQILVQYMYSGEATVSNDILSEVLRGGELLKIRGLCRTSASHVLPHHHHHQNLSSNITNYGTNGTRTLPTSSHCNTQQPPNGHGSDSYTHAKCSSSRYLIDHQQHQFRGLGVSVMPKDSPVIVKSPKMPTMALLPPPSSSKHIPITGCIGISINKEVAIDPEDKCCFVGNQQVLTETITNENDSSICTEMGCNSCSLSSAVEIEQLRRRQRSQSDDQTVATHHVMTERIEREHVHYQEGTNSMTPGRCDRSENDESQDERDIEYGQRMRRNSRNDHDNAYYMAEQYEHAASTTTSKHYADPIINRLSTSSPQEPHNFLTIKQEPSDWTATTSTLEGKSVLGGHRTASPTISMLSPKQPLDFKMPLTAVKVENTSAHNADEEEPQQQAGDDYDTLTRLICEICKKSFDDPKVWVRHLETHAGASVTMENHHQAEMSTESCVGPVAVEQHAKSYVPKKRRRVSQQENSVDHVTLLCDICSTPFETPAEWVRHMNNQHTEIELALFNSKKDNEQKTPPNTSGTSSNAGQHKKSLNRSSSHGYMDYSDRVCDICNKKFSSNSAMLLHKRNHNSDQSNNSSMSSAPIIARQQQSNGIPSRELQSATSPA